MLNKQVEQSHEQGVLNFGNSIVEAIFDDLVEAIDNLDLHIDDKSYLLGNVYQITKTIYRKWCSSSYNYKDELYEILADQLDMFYTQSIH